MCSRVLVCSRLDFSNPPDNVIPIFMQLIALGWVLVLRYWKGAEAKSQEMASGHLESSWLGWNLSWAFSASEIYSLAHLTFSSDKSIPNICSKADSRVNFASDKQLHMKHVWHWALVNRGIHSICSFLLFSPSISSMLQKKPFGFCGYIGGNNYIYTQSQARHILPLNSLAAVPMVSWE